MGPHFFTLLSLGDIVSADQVGELFADSEVLFGFGGQGWMEHGIVFRHRKEPRSDVVP